MSQSDPIVAPDVYHSVEAKLLAEKVNGIQLPDNFRHELVILLDRVDNLIKAGNYSEYEIISNYINWISRIPFGKFRSDRLDIAHVKEILDEHHFGLKEVKQKIVEYLSVLKLNEANVGSSVIVKPVLLFVGIQGVGKTTMARSISEALGREFVRIALGGLASERELKGQTRGMPGAEPGAIVKALVSTQTANPLILLDELDKVGGTNADMKRDIMSALLEILDLEQNRAFIDRYIGLPIDISQCIFIATANNAGGITSALLDRLEIVRFTSYTDGEKEQIARRYLLPKVLKNNGLKPEQIVMDDEVWPLMIRPLGFDAGIRELERTLTNVARKVASQIVEGKGDKFVISPANFREYIPDDFGVYT